jgi:hypothetical protein
MSGLEFAMRNFSNPSLPRTPKRDNSIKP